MSVTIKFRRGSSSAWTSNGNIILASGEPGYELDTGRFKIGNGITIWNNLPYAAIVPTGFLAGSGISINLATNGAYATINASGATISNYGNNRVLTSDGTSTGINGETNLTFDGSLLNISGNLIANTGSLDRLVFDTSLEDPDLSTGQLQWNSTEGTLDLGLTDNYTMHLGEEMLYRVRNVTGFTLRAGQPVYASGLSPGGNNRIEVNLYAANGTIREVRFMGLMTSDLTDNGNNGYATHFGYIRKVDTNGGIAADYSNKLWVSGEPDWAEGDILYVHPTVPGKLTKIEPKHSVSVAIVTKKANNGKLFVRPTSYGHLDDNHDVDLTGASNGQFLQYNLSTDYWIPSSSGNFTTLQVNGTEVSLSGHSHTPDNIIGLTWKGPWQEFTEYNSGDVVYRIFNNINSDDTPSLLHSLFYVCTDAATSETPGETAAWTPIIPHIGSESGLIVVTGPSGILTVASGINASLINDFNSSISGLLPTISNSGDNRILTSTGSTIGINAESNATFDGTNFNISGTLSVDNLYLDNNTIGATNANGNIIIQTTGTGALQRDSAGNIRGPYAVDWQNVRNTGSMVAAGDYSVIGGGKNNTASASYSTVAGGLFNIASGLNSIIGGGQNNLALSNRSFVNGTNNVAAQNARKASSITSSTNTINVLNATATSFDDTTENALQIRYLFDNVWFLTTRTVSSATQNGANVDIVVTENIGATGQFWSEVIVINTSETEDIATGQVVNGTSNIATNSFTTVNGGKNNSARGFNSVVGGGSNNASNNFYSVISGGDNNTADGVGSVVGGGLSNTSSGSSSVISGGSNNICGGQNSCIVGGSNNVTSQINSIIGGGSNNISYGRANTISGGNNNTSSADYSTIVGGFRGKTTRYGEVSHSSGRFQSDGDAQHITLVARTLTISGNFTVNISSPSSATFTRNGHSLKVGDSITFLTTGALPTPLNTTTTYYVIESGLTGSTFQLSTTPGGAAIVTSGTQSGTHTLIPTSSLTLNGALGLVTQQTMTVPLRTTWSFTIKLSAYNSQDNKGASFYIFGGLRRNNTATINLGNIQINSFTEGNFASSLINISTDNNSLNPAGDLDIRVTGLANKSIRWVAVIDISQVSYGTP